MLRKGFTLIEVILSITLIGLIAISFLPTITFGYRSIIDSEQFTRTTFEYQKLVEDEIEIKQGSEVKDPLPWGTIRVFGTDVKGHIILMNSDTSGEINVFVPQRLLTYVTPEIKSPPIIKVEKNNILLSQQPIVINLLDETYGFYVNEIEITAATKSEFLMNVYRWYLSEEMSEEKIPTNTPKDYTVIKEWNEAKKQIPYVDSQSLNFIPNIKDKYNRLYIKEVKDKLSLAVEDIINRFGNRYIRYGVTPYSIAGRIGKEELSNYIYFEAPRIVIKNAAFIVNENTFVVDFEDDITEEIDTMHITLNPELGEPVRVYRDSVNHKRLIFEFDHDINQSIPLDENAFHRGSVKSALYGAISIWSEDDPNGNFIIYP